MSTTSNQTALMLGNRFAVELPEMAIPWRAESAPDPKLLVLNDKLAEELGLDPDWLRTPSGIQLLLGNELPSGATPVAQAYAGHQFGGFSPRLGDGRALLLGDIHDVKGHERDLHLKGSGRTPFARGGDGLAAVGPMLREYIVSEAMHGLGVPTTRSLAVVGTGRQISRETTLPGAVLARVASSHLRVGSFQYARGTGNEALLRRLADHSIARHYPSAAGMPNPYLALFDSVVAAQALLVARWMLIGFVHGVMNTDNMTISGETIDYGPCAFLDTFDPATVYSSIDMQGRYAFGNQPAIAQWNLARLAESLLPLLAEDTEQAVALAGESLDMFSRQFNAAWSSGMLAKLGLAPDSDEEQTSRLVTDLLTLLGDNRVDYTSFFRTLGAHARGTGKPTRDLFLDIAGFDAWSARWRDLQPDDEVMNRVNPIYIPRNHLVEEALSAATEGELDPLHHLLAAITDPFRERPGLERFGEAAPASFGQYQTFCGT